MNLEWGVNRDHKNRESPAMKDLQDYKITTSASHTVKKD